MKNGICKIGLTALIAATVSLPAGAKTHSKSIIVVPPSGLPEIAQRNSEAMYLHSTGEGRAILYLEQDQGRTLVILDVTDPANIKAVAKASINAAGAYDFVQDLGSGALIGYRNRSGFAVINFRNYKAPALTPEPEYLHPASGQAYNDDGLLLISSHSRTNTAPKDESEYQVLTISSSSGATPLATIQNVKQRLDRSGTGTLFLLTDQGLTVVRSLAAEREHFIEEWQKSRN
jgi:hypothetical protein